jgi:copper chaperone
MNQTFNVQGMTCGHCERAVTQAVKPSTRPPR